MSGATFASIITFWLNGVQQPVATYLNPNAIWANGIQIWSRVTMNAGDTVKFQFTSGYITNPAAGQTVTWSWRTAEGSGATIESFSTTATVAGGATTTTSTTIPADTTAPTLSSRAPADGATGVSRTANLVLGFSENVSAVAGKFITIMDSDSNSSVEAISVTDSSVVTVSGSTVTVNPASTLDYGTDFFVRVDAGAFRDAAGNAYAGVWDSTLWNFTTLPSPDTTAPTLSSRTPADGATGVSRTANLVLGFSENVSAVAGKFITIMDSDSNSSVEAISVTDSSFVTVSGSTVTVNPSSTLDYGTDFFVRVDAGAFRDAAGNAYAGVWDSTLWNFTTLSDPTATTTTAPSTSVPSTTVPAAVPAVTTVAAPVSPQASVPTSVQVDSGASSPQTTATDTPTESSTPASVGTEVGVSTTTVVGASTGTGTVPRVSSTTAPSASTSTTTTVPDAPVLAGEFVSESSARVAYVDGRATDVTVTVESNRAISTFGNVTVTVRAVKKSGEPTLVNPDGSLPVREGDTVEVEAEGFAPESTVEIWMFSDPVFLGSVTVAADGRATFDGVIPDVPAGSHNLIFEGQVAAGDTVQVANPLVVLEDLGGTSIVRRVGTTAVWVLLILALLSGFIIPTRTRRRRVD